VFLTITAEESVSARPGRAAPARLARLRRAAEVLAALGAADLKLRYGRGRASTVKWLLDPIAAVGVYLLLVEFVLDRPGGAWALSIACAVFPFQLVMMTIINALNAVRLRQDRALADPGLALDTQERPSAACDTIDQRPDTRQLVVAK
jgi:hypothetical protein